MKPFKDFLLPAHGYRHSEVAQVLPLPHLVRPRGLGDARRGKHEHATFAEEAEQKVHSSERGDGLAQPESCPDADSRRIQDSLNNQLLIAVGLKRVHMNLRREG